MRLFALWLLVASVVGHAAEPPRFITALRAGQAQHIVIYGTSLSKSGAWVPQLQQALEARFPGLVKVTNSARGGQHSGWGAANVEAGVVAQQPDVVFIEFAINDAVTRFDLSLETVRRNVDTMLDRIAAAHPRCEIILQVMNPAVGKAEGDPSHRRNQDAYQQIYREAARSRRLRLIDHSVAWNRLLAAEGEAGFRRFVPDGVHPNLEGWRQIVLPTLRRELGLDE
jgi:acyl-CoA thioesterase-1